MVFQSIKQVSVVMVHRFDPKLETLKRRSRTRELVLSDPVPTDTPLNKSSVIPPRWDQPETGTTVPEGKRRKESDEG